MLLYQIWRKRLFHDHLRTVRVSLHVLRYITESRKTRWAFEFLEQILLSWRFNYVMVTAQFYLFFFVYSTDHVEGTTSGITPSSAILHLKCVICIWQQYSRFLWKPAGNIINTYRPRRLVCRKNITCSGTHYTCRIFLSADTSSSIDLYKIIFILNTH